MKQSSQYFVPPLSLFICFQSKINFLKYLILFKFTLYISVLHLSICFLFLAKAQDKICACKWTVEELYRQSKFEA